MHRMSLSDENLIIDCPMLSEAAPVVVGGIGGSGTRVIAQLLQSLDFDMGSDLNESLDDLGFTALFKRPSLWPLEDHVLQLNEALNVYLASRGHKSGSWTSQAHQNVRVAELLKSTHQSNEWIEAGNLSDREQFLTTLASQYAMGLERARHAHVLLPFLLAALPNMRYIHVTRHGLDMAHSSNQTQLKVWGARLLGRAVDTNQQTIHWRFGVPPMSAYCNLVRTLRSANFISTLRELFTDADSTLNNLCNFLGLPNTLAPPGNPFGTGPPQTIGRHSRIAASQCL